MRTERILKLFTPEQQLSRLDEAMQDYTTTGSGKNLSEEQVDYIYNFTKMLIRLNTSNLDKTETDAEWKKWQDRYDKLSDLGMNRRQISGLDTRVDYLFNVAQGTKLALGEEK